MTDQPTTPPPSKSIEPAYAATMPAPQGGALPTGLEWAALERMANTLADSDVIPYRLKRKPADVAVILLAAREYGIPPLMALSKLPVVNGTPAPMGELMVALILRAGHYIAADFRNPDGTIYAGGPLTPQHYGEARYRRRDWPTDGPDKGREVLRFTLDEALRAGLVDRITEDGRVIARVTKTKNGQQVEEVTPWEQYTPNMARWRAVANAARLNFADVLMGLSYLPEELGALVDADGAPVYTVTQVEEPRRTPPAGGTLEERTAQDAATQLEGIDVAAYAAQNPTGLREALDKGLTHAEENGYADAPVTFRGNAMTLTGAVAILRAELTELEATTAPATNGGEDTQPETPTQDAQNAPQAPEQAPDEAPTPPPPSEAVSAPAADESPAGVSDALEVAREAINAGDVDQLAGLYRGSTDLLAIDVLSVVDDDVLAALGAPPELDHIALGALLIKAAEYVKAHGTSLRDQGAGMGPAPTPSSTEDPWADDEKPVTTEPGASADSAGWPV